jgi:uncharacterized protein YgiM (DUF1202 family)
MKRNQRIFAVLLIILSLAFIVFVAIMQKQFNNPEFADLPSTSIESSSESEAADPEDTETDADGVAGAAESVVNEDEDEEIDEEAEEADEETEPTVSTRTVIAETLNARSGPGIEYDVTGILELDQVVEVEDFGDEWVRVITDEFTGYVNEDYLSEE